MKKLIKISLAVIAAMLFFLNVNLNFSGNKVEGMNLTTKIQTAKADAYCHWDPLQGDCYCLQEAYACAGLCPGGYANRICATE